MTASPGTSRGLVHLLDAPGARRAARAPGSRAADSGPSRRRQGRALADGGPGVPLGVNAVLLPAASRACSRARARLAPRAAAAAARRRRRRAGAGPSRADSGSPRERAGCPGARPPVYSYACTVVTLAADGDHLAGQRVLAELDDVVHRDPAQAGHLHERAVHPGHPRHASRCDGHPHSLPRPGAQRPSTARSASLGSEQSTTTTARTRRDHAAVRAAVTAAPARPPRAASAAQPAEHLRVAGVAAAGRRSLARTWRAQFVVCLPLGGEHDATAAARGPGRVRRRQPGRVCLALRPGLAEDSAASSAACRRWHRPAARAGRRGIRPAAASASCSSRARTGSSATAASASLMAASPRAARLAAPRGSVPSQPAARGGQHQDSDVGGQRGQAARASSGVSAGGRPRAGQGEAGSTRADSPITAARDMAHAFPMSKIPMIRP